MKKRDKTIQLWNIPRDSKIYGECSDGSSYVMFWHLDGMYSYCKTEKGAVVHLAVFTSLVEYKDGYKISKAKHL